jgi:hypothetical protein
MKVRLSTPISAAMSQRWVHEATVQRAHPFPGSPFDVSVEEWRNLFGIKIDPMRAWMEGCRYSKSRTSTAAQADAHSFEQLDEVESPDVAKGRQGMWAGWRVDRGAG